MQQIIATNIKNTNNKIFKGRSTNNKVITKAIDANSLCRILNIVSINEYKF